MTESARFGTRVSTRIVLIAPSVSNLSVWLQSDLRNHSVTFLFGAIRFQSKQIHSATSCLSSFESFILPVPCVLVRPPHVLSPGPWARSAFVRRKHHVFQHDRPDLRTCEKVRCVKVRSRPPRCAALLAASWPKPVTCDAVLKRHARSWRCAHEAMIQEIWIVS